jgi:polar amino acid transport system permease protein
VWNRLLDAGPLLLEGIGVTLLYTVVGALCAGVVSFVFGLMSLSRRTAVRGFSRTVVEFFRGTSIVVQLFWIVFALPQLGFKLTLFAAATVALALNFGAYGSEIVRGAISAVPKEQWEATVALSMSPWQRMRRVVLPQALPEMIPPFSNLLVQILKTTSVLYVIGITELTFELNDLRFDLGSLAAFTFGLVVYFLIAQGLVAIMRRIEHRAAAKVGRGPRAPGAADVRMPQAVPSGGW